MTYLNYRCKIPVALNETITNLFKNELLFQFVIKSDTNEESWPNMPRLLGFLQPA